MDFIGYCCRQIAETSYASPRGLYFAFAFNGFIRLYVAPFCTYFLLIMRIGMLQEYFDEVQDRGYELADVICHIRLNEMKLTL